MLNFQGQYPQAQQNFQSINILFKVIKGTRVLGKIGNTTVISWQQPISLKLEKFSNELITLISTISTGHFVVSNPKTITFLTSDHGFLALIVAYISLHAQILAASMIT
ncbi:hypothetical protein ACJX0J_039344, partial [Zea mays]